MNYSVNSLTTVGDCDVLLTFAAKERADLDYKKISDERITTRFAQSAAEIDAQLLGVNAEIAATEIIISTLPEGPSKEDAVEKKVTLVYKKFQLEIRKERYGTVALLEKEMDLGRVHQELREVDAFITAVTTKRDALLN
ncbi:MAG: hypothetical protein EOP53_26320 [Sphingobacteriales bacterium]|nr:MAG: hypothetical protein EOP53_26320 [Sphingobacteriales bacterium]